MDLLEVQEFLSVSVMGFIILRIIHFFTSLKNKSPGRCSDHISFVTSKIQKLGEIVECCSEVGREVGEFGRVLLGPH